MKEIRKIVKEDFENKANTNLKFDTSKLENNPNKHTFLGKIVGFSALGTVCSLVAVFAIVMGSMVIKVDEDTKLYTQVYAANEVSDLEKNSLKKLNEVTYPDGKKVSLSVSEEYKYSVKKFADKMYKKLNDDGKNLSFSPYTLYSNLCIDSLASNSEKINNDFDEILGVSKSVRTANFVNALKNDFYFNDGGTTQMYNGSFISKSYKPNPEFIDQLTSYLCEAYQINFSSKSDIAKMLSWIDERIDEKGFLTEKDLEINQNSVMYNFSTFFFDNRWKTEYLKDNTKKLDFKVDDSSTVNCDFMCHSYMGDYYDYGSYSAVYDYYKNGMKVKYLIPNSNQNLNIFDLTKNANIFTDDETKKIVLPLDKYDSPDPVINLKMPKFENEYMYDFTSLLQNNGLKDAFTAGNKAFNYAFTDLSQDADIVLQIVKQKNKVSFSEDGSKVKSVTFSGMAATSAGPMELGTVDITLDEPFIYIIYDSNDLPLFMGHVNNPTL